MSDVVVDSSVAAKWFLPEADSPQALRVMTETIAAGGRLIVLYHRARFGCSRVRQERG